MRSRFAILIFFLFLSVVALAQRKRAFLVGISHYDTALTGYQWNNIHGVEDVKLLSPILNKQGFLIQTILDNQATFNNIKSQLSTFINKTKKGDIVYLHFSTHGQPVEDIDGDETDGWDESIVPIDAYKIYKKGTYEGEKHLIDDQLNLFVGKLREKIGPKGFLYVVIDACHAGTASRTLDETVRGTSVGFSANNKIFRPSKEKRSHYNIKFSSNLCNVIFLEACCADQRNMEIKIDNNYYGALSFNIAQMLSTYNLTNQGNFFLEHLKKYIMQHGQWPNNQNLVTETSF